MARLTLLFTVLLLVCSVRSQPNPPPSESDENAIEQKLVEDFNNVDGSDLDEVESSVIDGRPLEVDSSIVKPVEAGPNSPAVENDVDLAVWFPESSEAIVQDAEQVHDDQQQQIIGVDTDREGAEVEVIEADAVTVSEGVPPLSQAQGHEFGDLNVAEADVTAQMNGNELDEGAHDGTNGSAFGVRIDFLCGLFSLMFSLTFIV